VQDKNNLFPVFLKLENLHTLLVGGGNVALEKIGAMLNNAPLSKITVVAPLIRDELKEFVRDYPKVELIERSYQHSDLTGKSVVVCATDNPVLHCVVRASANARGLLVNVADVPPLCDFYLGSIVQKGNLKIAISTNGKSPTIAKRLKEVLNEGISENINDLLESINKLRESLKGDFNEKIRILNEHTERLVK
jgi:siroheme synthase-like protein